MKHKLNARIPIDHDKIADFCRRHHIRRLWLFGSVLNDDFREDSDIDILYEFQPEKTPGFAIFRVIEGLSELIGGQKVDFVSDKYLSRRIRNHPAFHKEVLYDEG